MLRKVIFEKIDGLYVKVMSRNPCKLSELSKSKFLFHALYFWPKGQN